MTTAHCPRCLQFVSPLRRHACPCDSWEHRRPEPRPTRIGHWATWLAASALSFVVLLAVAANATPRSEPQPVDAPVPPSQEVAPVTAGALSGASLTLPSLPAAASLPVAEPIRTTAPVPTPPETDTAEGWATWCGPTPTQCQSWAPPAMLGAVPSFRWGDEPYRVRVTRGERSVVVTVVSFCACRDRHGDPTLVDLSPAAFRQLGPLSRGVLRVEMEELP